MSNKRRKSSSPFLNLLNLPEELIDLIQNYLNIRDLKSLSETCKLMARITKENRERMKIKSKEAYNKVFAMGTNSQVYGGFLEIYINDEISLKDIFLSLNYLPTIKSLHFRGNSFFDFFDFFLIFQ